MAFLENLETLPKTENETIKNNNENDKNEQIKTINGQQEMENEGGPRDISGREPPAISANSDSLLFGKKSGPRHPKKASHLNSCPTALPPKRGLAAVT